MGPGDGQALAHTLKSLGLEKLFRDMQKVQFQISYHKELDWNIGRNGACL
jgi:hypothetical protein